MKNSILIKKQTTLLIVTILFLSIIFGYYFFIYIPEHERNAENRVHRILSRLTKNINLEESAYRAYAKKYVMGYIDLTRKVGKNNQKQDLSSRFIIDSINGDKKGNDKVKFISLSNHVDIKSPFPLHIFNNYTKSITFVDTLHLKKSEAIQYAFEINVANSLNEIVVTNDLVSNYILFSIDSSSNNKTEDKTPVLKVDINHNIETTIQEKKIDKPQLAKQKRYQIYSNFSNVFTEIEIDSLLKYHNNKSKEVSINGEKYRVFTQYFPFTDKIGVVCGFVPIKKYNSEIKEIPSSIIFTLSIIILLILFFIPLLKIFNMGHLQRLKVSDIISCGFAHGIGVSFITILVLSTWDYYYTEGNAINKQLKSLNDTLSNTLLNEIHDINRQLEEYNNNPDFDLKYNVGILADSNTPSYPRIYPYFKESFWIDYTGHQKGNISTDKFNKSIPDLDLSKRSYFSQIKGDSVNGVIHQYFPLNQKSNKMDFALQSIFSYEDGLKFAVISKKYDGNQDGSIAVSAISTKLYSLFNTIIPKGFEFAVIDSKGDVLFHSDSTKNLRENLLEETDNNDLLQTGILTHTAIETHLDSYHGMEHTAYIKPIHKFNLFLVTMYETEYTESSRSIIVWLTFMFVLLSFLLFATYLVLVHLSDKRFSKIKPLESSFDWLIPNLIKENISTTIVFLVLNTIILFVYHYILSFEFKDYSLVYALLCPIVTISACYILFHLKSNSSEKSTAFFNLKTLHYLLYFLPFIFTLLILFIYD